MRGNLVYTSRMLQVLLLIDSALDRGALEGKRQQHLPSEARHSDVARGSYQMEFVHLQEGVRRWTKSVFIRFNNRGKVLGHRLSNSVLFVQKNGLTYLEAQALIDGDDREARKHSVTGGAYTTATH